MDRTKLPPHIQYAIEHEERCIKFREKQIKNYKRKIKYLEAGVEPSIASKKIPPLHGVIFDAKEYYRLRKGYEEKRDKKCKKKKK